MQNPGCCGELVVSVCWLLVPVYSLCCLEKHLLSTQGPPRCLFLSSVGSKTLYLCCKIVAPKYDKAMHVFHLRLFSLLFPFKKRTCFKEIRTHTLLVPGPSTSPTLIALLSVRVSSICLFVSIYLPTYLSIRPSIDHLFLSSICHLSVIYHQSTYHLSIIYHLLSISIIYQPSTNDHFIY